MATLAWAEVDAAGPVRVVTTVIGLLCASVWVHRAQVDRWIQTHFDRAFHVDTGAVAPHIAAARHKAWWTGTAVPLLRTGFTLAPLVCCGHAVLYGHVDEGSPMFLILTFTSTAAALAAWIGNEGHLTAVYRIAAIVPPAMRYLSLAWPATSDACFRALLAKAGVFNALLAVFTMPPFSEFVVWRLGPIVLCTLFSAPHVPALHAMPRPQVAVLCAGAIGAAVVHPCVRAWHRQRLYAPLVAGEDNNGKDNSRHHQHERARLFGKKPGFDPEFDLLMDPHLAWNKYPFEKMEKLRAAKHCSLAATFCTPDVWDKYKDTVSSGPGKWTLARAINSGIMFPRANMGCHVGDAESYDDFKDLFYPVIRAYHGFDMESARSSAENTACDGIDGAKISVKLTASARRKVVSTRIRVARNIAGFPLNPAGSRQSREDVAMLMEEVFAGLAQADPALAGRFHLHSCMSDAQRQALVDGHWLFRGKDARQAAAGYHQHWPNGRGVFLNAGATFVVWVNEGDHLRIIAMEKGNDVQSVFRRLAVGLRAIERGTRRAVRPPARTPVFMTHPKFGAVTCCPTNIGTGLRASVFIEVPKLLGKLGLHGVDELARARDCQARGAAGEFTEATDKVDLSNWRRVGVPEYELVQDMIECANFLAAEEDKMY